MLENVPPKWASKVQLIFHVLRDWLLCVIYISVGCIGEKRFKIFFNNFIVYASLQLVLLKKEHTFDFTNN